MRSLFFAEQCYDGDGFHNHYNGLTFIQARSIMLNEPFIH